MKICTKPWYVSKGCNACIDGECLYKHYDRDACGADEDKMHADMEEFAPDRMER